MAKGMGFYKCTNPDHKFYSNDVCVACDREAPRFRVGSITMNELDILNALERLAAAELKLLQIRELL